ncbi:aminopeptidase N [Sturnira hondurensis]|uniref:aminopeptidase N n=1 Tax=Sturnira hondurensis TaxID=192404 RepID=UPI001879E6C9|nr:aminopeptidase N [Sturnira hondurensis]
MAKGFYISKPLGILGIILCVGAVATIIALSVVYSQEKSKDTGNPVPNPTSPSTTTATTLDPSKPWNRYRLPRTLEPESYKVKLRPYLTPNKDGLYIFEGSSTVRFKCKEATDVIIIHSKKLKYVKTPEQHLVTLRGVGGAPVPAIDRTELVEVTEYLVVHLKGQLQAGGLYEMDSQFEGELSDDLGGFYRSEYMDGNEKKVLATTQMEPTDARKSFPCFDEPSMKAQFNITLVHPNNFKALSNMLPQGSSVPLEGDPTWMETQFHPTPVMSTYLLAYIVSEFTSVEREEEMSPNNNVLIRIWARPSATQAGHSAYALNVTGPILKFFAGHYATAYPLEKSDQIGLPDFNAGAMENWGLVTYRENSLLFDPLDSSINNKERVVTVIAHELAHQWFGNLVTLAWWNDLWLNEGFASYVEYLGADYAEPTWNLKDLIVQNEVYSVMAIDALASSHPLTTPAEEVTTPAQINELFDTITYSKGAAVLRMLSSFLTEDLFKTGLASYLSAFAYNSATYQDLWGHLQKAVDNQKKIELPKNVSTIMERWVLQMGFPLVTVDTKTGTISQQYFLLDPQSKPTRPSPFNYQWIIHISSLKGGDQKQEIWLEEDSKVIEQFKTEADDWVLLNINVTDYYQVNYDEDNWRKIRGQLQRNLSAIPVLNRAQIIHDAFDLASSRMVNVTLALDNTLFLIEEKEYLPWEAALSSLNYFKLMLDRSTAYVHMQNYLRKQVTPLFDYFRNITRDWTQRPETLMEQYNEVNAISTACSSGISDCQNLVSQLYHQWMTNPKSNPIHPNLRSTVYCHAIAQGGEEEWNFAWEQFQKATLVNEADKLRAALACSKQVWILDRYLRYTLNSTLIRKQDATSSINSIASNVLGQTLAWNFVQANWKKLFVDYGGGSFSFSRVIQAITQRFSTEEELQMLEQFKADNADTGFGTATRALEQALEKTRANIKWVKENKAVVEQWFAQNS